MWHRLLTQTDRRCLWKFTYNLGIKGSIALTKFRKRLKKGDFFPAFHFISVTDDCNLHCQGCWVTGKQQNVRMPSETLHSIIRQSKEKGSYFFGILGGEPLMYKSLLEVLGAHPDCYFQLFTNGTLLDCKFAEELRRLGNVTPLISFEGDEHVADIRRGGSGVFTKAQAAIDACTQAGLITGVAMSVCKSNMDLAMSDSFIRSLIDRGVLYLWYYIYRPVGQDAMVDLALSRDEIDNLRRFMVEARTRYKIAIIDAYWDQNGEGICPAATGLSHHINASGDIEPCPIIQFSANNVKDASLEEIYREATFLKTFRENIPSITKGCVVMEHPEWIVAQAEQRGVRDSSGRNNEKERLSKMNPVPSHGSATPIKEASWIYRFAKKNAFFGLGAYG